MCTTFVHVGFGNFVATNRVLGMEVTSSKPVKRAVADAAEKGLLITLTKGRGSKTAIFLDTGHIALSSLEPETIASRVTNEEGEVKTGALAEACRILKGAESR
jgi:regulator of extracellular matrix RemA (YlzA/DUF370 family)